MAQRLRGLQRGAALLAHQAEPATAAAQGFLAASSSANSLLQQLQQEQHHQRGGGHWQQSWGGSVGVRHLSFWRSAPAVPSKPPAEEQIITDTPTPEVPEMTTPPEFFPLPEDNAMEVVSAISQACDALEKASIMGAKADAFLTSSWCISGLQAVHEAMGAPWWVSIAVFNVTLRILTFPLMVLSQKGTAKIMEFNHGIIHAKKLQEAAMKASSTQEHDRLMRAFRAEYMAQVEKQGNPMKAGLMVPAVMILNGGIFLSIFSGISKLMAAKAPSLTTGGALWFHDLTMADPYFGLPIMCTLVTLAMVEFGINLTGDSNPMQDQKAQAQKGLKWLLRGFALMFIPAGNYVAAGTAVLWVSNTAFGVVQGLMLRNDVFRSKVGLPTMQAIREMNQAVAEANAASAPKPAAGAAANPFSTKAADAGPAVNTPLMSNYPKSFGGPAGKQ